jgi:hypothetical protein
MTLGPCTIDIIESLSWGIVLVSVRFILESLSWGIVLVSARFIFESRAILFGDPSRCHAYNRMLNEMLCTIV